MVLVLSFFIFIIIFLSLGMMFSKIKIKVKQFDFKMSNKEIYKNKYFIETGLFLFGFLKIFSINIKNKSIKFLGKNINYNKIKNSAIYKKIIKTEMQILDKKKLFSVSRKIDFKFERFKLNLSFGTDNTLITSFVTFIISTMLGFILQKGITKYNPKKYSYIITPKYENYNLADISLNCNISFEFLKLVKIIYEITKKEPKVKEEKVLKKKKASPGYV